MNLFCFFCFVLMCCTACDLKERIITRKAIALEDTIPPKQKLMDSIKSIKDNAFYNGLKEGGAKALDMLVTHSPEGKAYLKQFLSTNKSERTRFIQQILYDHRFENEAKYLDYSRNEKEYGLFFNDEKSPDTQQTLFMRAEKPDYFGYSEYGYGGIVGWFYRAGDLDPKIQANVLAYLIHSIDRKPHHIEAIYNQYKDIILQHLKPEAYHKLAKGWVKSLIKSYQYWQKNDYKKPFEKYKAMPKDDIKNYSFREGRKLTLEEMQKKRKNHGSISYQDNFWYRRYTEGTMNIVYKILTEVDAYYSQFPVPKEF